MDKKHCVGCIEDFYNGKNPPGVKECWMLKDAKVMARFSISINAPMGARANYIPEKRPSCYRASGVVYLNKIPDYAQ